MHATHEVRELPKYISFEGFSDAPLLLLLASTSPMADMRAIASRPEKSKTKQQTPAYPRLHASAVYVSATPPRIQLLAYLLCSSCRRKSAPRPSRQTPCRADRKHCCCCCCCCCCGFHLQSTLSPADGPRICWRLQLHLVLKWTAAPQAS